MNGPIAQMVALTCHLNARRRGISTPRLFPDNSTCQFCESVWFRRPKRRLFVRTGCDVVARLPDEWMDGTVTSGFARAILSHHAGSGLPFSDRMTAGLVGGGGRWLLSVEHEGRSDDWEAAWEVGNREAADRRIWKVVYTQVVAPTHSPSSANSPDGLITELKDALTSIEAFARDHDLGGFAESFAKAQSCLSADEPFTLVYHRDLAPDGALDLSGARLLACSQAAWVFGGMGSWNDLGFDGEDENQYRKLSDRLFALVNQAICAGANATAVFAR